MSMKLEHNPQTDLNQRGWDLLRQMRSELYNQDLITEAELTCLMIENPGHAAVARLENYDAVQAQIETWKARNEQAEVQLAGCGVAALGGTKDPATKGMYGWSQSYQDTLDLRLKYERLQSLLQAAFPILLRVAQSSDVMPSKPDYFNLRADARWVINDIQKPPQAIDPRSSVPDAVTRDRQAIAAFLRSQRTQIPAERALRAAADLVESGSASLPLTDR